MTTEKQASLFIEMKTQFLAEVNNSFESGNVDNIKLKWSSLEAKDSEKRTALEQSLRDKLVSLLYESQDPENLTKYLTVVMKLCRQEIVAAVLSVSLLSDVLDSSTIAVCEKLFEFVENHVSTWKCPAFFSSCKNNILRMCNDLLRRLSKAQNTVFCGRILLFLAMFFPFSERSGLNIVSEFNVDKDNFMKYDVDDVEEEPLQVSDTPVKLDSNFYSQFWSLQEYFRSPTLCYNKVQWKEFVKNSNAVLTVFKNFKLDWDPNCEGPDSGNKMFFTKFLTNQKLLLLQLSDTDFRRTIYLQFLILFQFLSAQVKTKDTYELKTEQLEWVKNSVATIQQLIKDSPPNGEVFLKSVELILKREEHWSSWKNDGCPALKKIMPNYEKDCNIRQLPSHSSTVADLLYEKKAINRLIFLKSDNTSDVLDLRQDYLQYLPGRNCSPSLNDFLAEAIQQSEPQEPIDPKTKKVNDPRFAWIALKLLSLKSPHFFSVNHNPIPKLPDFVDHICRRLFRERNPGMLLPPLTAAPKSFGKADVKKAGALKTQKIAGKVAKAAGVKLQKGQVVKHVKTAAGKIVKAVPSVTSAGNGVSSKSKEPLVKSTNSSSEIRTVAVSSSKSENKTNDRSESGSDKDKNDKFNSSNDKHERHEKDRVDRYERSNSRYEKNDRIPSSDKSLPSKSEKNRHSEKLDRNSSPSSLSRDKSLEKRSSDKVSSSDRSDSSHRKTSSDKNSAAKKEKSPGKRKRDGDLDKETSPSAIKKSKDKKDERKESRDEYACTLTPDVISKLAKSISGSWKKVAEKLGYKSDEIEYFETCESSDHGRAVKLLLVWASNEDDATPESLRHCLKNLGLSESAKILSSV